MSDLRKAAQQALWALQYHVEMTWPIDRTSEAIFNLRAALAQQEEPKGGGRLPPPLLAEPVQEPDLSRCPQCNGPADNGHDRSIPPNPYFCTRCMAEPVQEPVAWRFQSAVGGWAYGSQPPLGSKYPVHPLYTVPPRCPNCASLEAQNTELDRKLAEMERERSNT